VIGAFQAVHGIALEFHAHYPWVWFHPRLMYLLNEDTPLSRAVLPPPKPQK